MRSQTISRTSLSVIAAGFVAAMTISSTAGAHTAMKWCTHWLTGYMDSGYGEDYLNTVGTAYYDAEWTYAQVVNLNTSTIVWEGELDTQGCSPFVDVVAGTQYRFRQATKAQRGYRRIYVNPDTGDWGASYVYFNSYFTTVSPLLVNYHYEHVFYPNWSSPKANLMPISGRILDAYGLLEYPASTYTYIRNDSNHCTSTKVLEGGAYYVGDGQICLLGSGAFGWDDATQYKFVVGHVLGHRIADATGGPMIASYDWSDSPPMCQCSYFDYMGGISYGGDAHCMFSRGPIEGAEREGFAHFYSSAVLNIRNSVASYVHWQETNYCTPAKGFVMPDTDPPHTFDPGFGNGGCYSYMQYTCPTADANGIELDWMDFLWEIWTDDSTGGEFSIDEITNVWAASSGDDWNDLKSTVGSIWGEDDPKYDQFVLKGETAGVDHVPADQRRSKNIIEIILQRQGNQQ